MAHLHGHDVLGRVATELHDQVSSRSAESRLDMDQQWLRSRREDNRGKPVRPELIRAWRVLQDSGGRCRIEDLAREVALSPRQLSRSRLCGQHCAAR